MLNTNYVLLQGGFHNHEFWKHLISIALAQNDFFPHLITCAKYKKTMGGSFQAQEEPSIMAYGENVIQSLTIPYPKVSFVIK